MMLLGNDMTQEDWEEQNIKRDKEWEITKELLYEKNIIIMSDKELEYCNWYFTHQLSKTEGERLLAWVYSSYNRNRIRIKEGLEDFTDEQEKLELRAEEISSEINRRKNN